MAIETARGGDLTFAADLFKAADKLRQNVEPSEYKHIALGLIFLKYVSDAFEAQRNKLTGDPHADQECQSASKTDPGSACKVDPLGSCAARL